MSWQMLVGVLGLGVAGLDPVGALIAAGGIAAGARRSAVAAFFLSSLIVTVGIGAVLGTSVERITMAVSQFVAVPDGVRVSLQTAACLALGAWALWRWRRGPRTTSGTSVRATGTSIPAMSAAGVVWGVLALTDVTFYGAAALTAPHASLATRALAITVWFVVSQAPLCLVTAAHLYNANGRAVAAIVGAARRSATYVRPVLTAVIALTAAILGVSSLAYLTTGQFTPL